jgi:hypothetical protein
VISTHLPELPSAAQSTAHRFGDASRQRSRPVIETAAYNFDRVQRIEVALEVPGHLAALGNLDGWRAMARAEAFERLMQEIDVNAAFTVECHLREEKQFTDGRHISVVICELRYAFNR